MERKEEILSTRTPSVKRTSKERKSSSESPEVNKKINMAEDYSLGGALFDLDGEDGESDKDNNTEELLPSETSDGINTDPIAKLNAIREETLVLDADTPQWAKSAFNQIWKRIDSVIDSLEFTDSQTVKSMKQSADASKSAAQSKSLSNEILTKVGARIIVLEQEKKNLEDTMVKMETYTRQNNLLFYGFPEYRYESDLDCYQKVRNVIAKLDLNPNMQIARCHRKGPYSPNQKSPRPIIVAFQWFGDRNAIWSRKKWLKRIDDNIFVSEDFPEEIERRRRILYPIFKKARRLPAYKGQVSMQKDRLIVDSKTYTVETMHMLPEPINPWQLSQQTDSDSLAFFSIHHPFSNFHPSPFKVDGLHFSCNEQYLFYNKAHVANDVKTASQIMATSDPYRIKRISKQIKTDEEQWKSMAPAVMKTGLLAKFKQNSHLKHWLMATGKKKLIEGSKSDLFWGVGMSHKDPKILNSDNWPQEATNMLGKLLEDVRSELSPYPLLSRGAASMVSD